SRKAKPAAKPPAQTTGNAAAAPPAEQPDGSVLLTDRAPAHLHFTLRPECDWVAALPVELLPAPGNGGSVLPPRMAARARSLPAAGPRAGGKTDPVSFRHAGANLAEPRYQNGFAIVGVQGGWKLAAAHASEPHVSVWLPASPLHLASGDEVTLTFPN